ncbi:hypothetical protein KCU92_g10216, partial [Aureobasidium melanogenum]
GHSQLKTGHPVRSAIHKQLNGRLVLRWVTTWESLLLYVLQLLLLSAHNLMFCVSGQRTSKVMVLQHVESSSIIIAVSSDFRESRQDVLS